MRCNRSYTLLFDSRFGAMEISRGNKWIRFFVDIRNSFLLISISSDGDYFQCINIHGGFGSGSIMIALNTLNLTVNTFRLMTNHEELTFSSMPERWKNSLESRMSSDKSSRAPLWYKDNAQMARQNQNDASNGTDWLRLWLGLATTW